MTYQGDPRSQHILAQLFPQGEVPHLRLGKALARSRAPHTVRGTRSVFLPDVWSLTSTLRAVRGGGFPDRSRQKSQFLKEASGYVHPVVLPESSAGHVAQEAKRHVTEKEVQTVETHTAEAGTDTGTLPQGLFESSSSDTDASLRSYPSASESLEGYPSSGLHADAWSGDSSGSEGPVGKSPTAHFSFLTAPLLILTQVQPGSSAVETQTLPTSTSHAHTQTPAPDIAPFDLDDYYSGRVFHGLRQAVDSLASRLRDSDTYIGDLRAQNDAAFREFLDRLGFDTSTFPPGSLDAQTVRQHILAHQDLFPINVREVHAMRQYIDRLARDAHREVSDAHTQTTPEARPPPPRPRDAFWLNPGVRRRRSRSPSPPDPRPPQRRRLTPAVHHRIDTQGYPTPSYYSSHLQTAERDDPNYQEPNNSTAQSATPLDLRSVLEHNRTNLEDAPGPKRWHLERAETFDDIPLLAFGRRRRATWGR